MNNPTFLRVPMTIRSSILFTLLLLFITSCTTEVDYPDSAAHYLYQKKETISVKYHWENGQYSIQISPCKIYLRGEDNIKKLYPLSSLHIQRESDSYKKHKIYKLRTLWYKDGVIVNQYQRTVKKTDKTLHFPQLLYIDSSAIPDSIIILCSNGVTDITRTYWDRLRTSGDYEKATQNGVMENFTPLDWKTVPPEYVEKIKEEKSRIVEEENDSTIAVAPVDSDETPPNGASSEQNKIAEEEPVDTADYTALSTWEYAKTMDKQQWKDFIIGSLIMIIMVVAFIALIVAMISAVIAETIALFHAFVAGLISLLIGLVVAAVTSFLSLLGMKIADDTTKGNRWSRNARHDLGRPPEIRACKWCSTEAEDDELSCQSCNGPIAIISATAVTCGWCGTHTNIYEGDELVCPNCGGNIPSPVPGDPGPEPIAPKRKVHKAFVNCTKWWKNGLTIIGFFVITPLGFAGMFMVWPLLLIPIGTLVYKRGLKKGKAKISAFENGVSVLGKAEKVQVMPYLFGRTRICYSYSIGSQDYKAVDISYRNGALPFNEGEKVWVVVDEKKKGVSAIWPPVL